MIGADLLHLKDISKIGSDAVSLGGAGAFDGVILAGITASFLQESWRRI